MLAATSHVSPASLKRCRADSSASALSPLASVAASSPAMRVVASSAACRHDAHESTAASTGKCIDGSRSATECRVPTALTIKDLLNDVESPKADDLQYAADTSRTAPREEWMPRITVEKMEIEASSESCPVSQAAKTEHTDAKATGAIDDALERKCKRLAELIRGSKHLVAFTGAGISTSVGLPDYRGDNGIRTKGFEKHKRRKVTIEPSSRTAAARDHGALMASSSSSSSSDSESAKKQQQQAPGIPDFNQLVPSKTHMALYELHRLGFLKHVVSQNVDNLHLKSGLPASVLTEVHGNATQAKCETCEKIYTQDFPWTGLCDDRACVSTKRSVEQRLRARTRHGNGRLKRNVISFDEPLGDIDNAIDECEAADVALVLGTSLRVEPFSEMAGEYAEALAIVNLQPTTQKLDARAETSGVRLFAKCDVVMAKTMKYLLGDNYEIPAWSGEHPTSVFIPEHEETNLVNVLAGRLLA